ncbi:MAG: glycosyltransferase family 39 protein [Candidatus Omnitrophica bacterium]|nr:glycosyltransferase family 39 protein [Candidatus Omnitrophota bacterium]
MSRDPKSTILQTDEPVLFYRALLIIILAIAAVIRFKDCVLPYTWSDEALYLWCGQRILQNPLLLMSKEVIQYHPPLLPILIAISNIYFGANLATHLTGPTFGVIGVFLVYLLGARLESRFVGLAAAAFLAFDIFHIEYSRRILTDVPMTTMMLFFAYSLVRWTADGRRRWLVISDISGLLAIMLKWSGAILLPFLILFHIAIGLLRKDSKNIIANIFFNCRFTILFIILLLLNNFLKMRSLLPDTTAIGGFLVTGSPLLYLELFTRSPYYPNSYFLIFFLVGLIVILTGRKKENMVMYLGWLAVFFVIIAAAKERDPRYILPIIPFVGLISAIGLEGVLVRAPKLHKIKVLPILLIVLFIFDNFRVYPVKMTWLKPVERIGTDFRDAGDWIKTHIDENSTIIASDYRTIRLYSGINLEEFGGQIIRMEDFTELRDFENYVNQTRQKNDIFLQVDVYNPMQPKWIFPAEPRKIQRLYKMGFEPVYTGFEEGTEREGQGRASLFIFHAKKMRL